LPRRMALRGVTPKSRSMESAARRTGQYLIPSASGLADSMPSVSL